MATLSTDHVMVSTKRGIIPFSVGYLARTLLAIGITNDVAYKESRNIAEIVGSQEKDLFTADEIMEIAHDWFLQIDKKKSERIKIIQNDFKELHPLVILVGGVTGIGKSTITTLFASRLGIKSILGSDLIREVMRVTISRELMPTLHTSTYEAHTKMNTSFLPILSKNIVGYETQAKSVTIGVEAAIDQAIKENEIVVIEGVHLTPGLFQDRIINNSRVIFIHLKLDDQEIHNSRLKIRETKTSVRGTSYIDHFTEIREIQNYLNEQAIIAKIPIIDVLDEAKAILSMLEIVWSRVLD